MPVARSSARARSFEALRTEARKMGWKLERYGTGFEVKRGRKLRGWWRSLEQVERGLEMIRHGWFLPRFWVVKYEDGTKALRTRTFYDPWHRV